MRSPDHRQPVRLFAVAIAIAGYVLAIESTQFLRTDLPPTGPIYGADLTWYFIPSFSFMRDAMAAGELPLWNPYQFAGVPFLALHSPGAVYPPNYFLLWAFTPSTAAFLHAVLHLLVAGVFTAALARKLGASAPGAAAAAVTYIGSAPLVGACLNPAYLATFSWFPAVLLAIENLRETPNARTSAILALTSAMAFLGGHSQGFLYITSAAVLYTAGTMVGWPSPSPRKTVAWGAAALAVALGLVSAQLLPTIEHAAAATRNLGGLPQFQAAFSTITWQNFPRSITGFAQGLAGLPFAFLPLLLVALLSPQSRRRSILLVAILVFAFDFMTGGLTFRALYHLPGGKLYRAPFRFGFVLQLAAALIVALGTTSLAQHITRKRTAALLAALIVGFIGLDLLIRNPLAKHYDLLFPPTSKFPATSVVEHLKVTAPDRTFLERLVFSNVPIKAGMTNQSFLVPDYEPLLPGHYAKLFRIPPMQRWHGQLHMEGFTTKGLAKPPTQKPHVMDLLSVRYYIDSILPRTRSYDMAALLDAKPISIGPNPVFERPSARPRAYVVHSAIQAASDTDALEMIWSSTFAPDTTVVVTDDPGPLPGGKTTPTELATITEYRRNSVALSARCESPCLLVLTDLYYPGWVVTIDGRPDSIVRTNYLLRGVRLEAGEHEVIFSYQPKPFYIGAALSACSLAIAGLALVAGGRAGPPRSRLRTNQS